MLSIQASGICSAYENCVRALRLELKRIDGGEFVPRDRERCIVVRPRAGDERIGKLVARIGISGAERPDHVTRQVVFRDRGLGQRDG